MSGVDGHKAAFSGDADSAQPADIGGEQRLGLRARAAGVLGLGRLVLWPLRAMVGDLDLVGLQADVQVVRARVRRLRVQVPRQVPRV